MELLVAGIAAGAVAGFIVVIALLAFFRRGQVPAVTTNLGENKSKDGQQHSRERHKEVTKGPEDDDSAGKEEDPERYSERFAEGKNELRKRTLHQSSKPQVSNAPADVPRQDEDGAKKEKADSEDFNVKEETPQTYKEDVSGSENKRRVRSSPPPYTVGRESSPPPSYEDHFDHDREKSKSFYPKETVQKTPYGGEGSQGSRSVESGEMSSFGFHGTENEQSRGIDDVGFEEETFRESIAGDNSGRTLKETHEKLRHEKTDSPIDVFPFEVDKKGCRIDAPYCRLHFPPNATKRPIHMKMRPEYNYRVIKEDKIQICPTISFSSEDEMNFDRNITIAIQTSYIAIPGKKITVQVIRRRNSESPFTVYKTVDHGNLRFIEFDVKHFCSYSVEADESQFRNMEKNYYSAVYVKKPTNDEIRYLNWLIYDDCPKLVWEQLTYLKEKEMFTDPELFSIRYNHNLQLSLKGRNVNIPICEYREPFSEKWGSWVNRSFQFKITRDESNRDADTEMTYDITAKHARTQDPKSVLRSIRFLQWHREEDKPGVQINVQGERATGVQHHYYGGTETQISRVSVASSGIDPDFNSGDSRVEELDEEIMEGQDDDDLPADSTLPKSTLEQSHDPKPISHSTPRDRRSTTVAKEEVESMGPLQKSFTS